MTIAARLASIVLAFALAACAAGGPDETAGRNTSFDGEVLRIELPRKDGGREKFSTLRDRWFSWSWAPFLPNNSGRRWTLLKTDTDGTSVAYAVVSWDNDDPTDYLAAGYWLRFDGIHSRRLPVSEATTTLFIDGPELDPAFPPSLPPAGTARYAGSAGGTFAYRYGSDWIGNSEPVSAEEFTATMTAEANFDDMTIAGCIGCLGDIEIDREHLYVALGWRREQPLARPTAARAPSPRSSQPSTPR